MLKGDKGEPGDSAYQVAVNNGFEGTEQEWLASLEGAPGQKGETGAPGADGKDGKDGTDGADGNPGVYVGTTAPTDDSLIWINPEEEGAVYATTDYVDNAIANIDIPEGSAPDLSAYYTKTETDTAIAEAVAGVDIPTVPTAVSAFTNDAGYQTEAQVTALINTALTEVENGTY